MRKKDDKSFSFSEKNASVAFSPKYWKKYFKKITKGNQFGG